MGRVAVIDIGTVTCRLGIADVEQGRVLRCAKSSTICNLGQGVAQTGMLAKDAIERVLACVNQYLMNAYEAGVRVACCTLTSAARDAKNSSELIDGLHKLGIAAQVIPGDIEGSLTFLGVAQDFVGEHICVADNGGGSTEIAVGTLKELDGQRTLDIEAVHSINLGCRRLTDMFLSRQDPPTSEDIQSARTYCKDVFAQELPSAAANLNDGVRLVCVGGTVTTLVAIHAGLEPYNPAFVHLHELKRSEVDELAESLASVPLEERRNTKGLQPKRAEVILGGALCVSELMAATESTKLTVSESDLLFGLSIVCEAAASKKASPIGWLPELFALR